MGYAPHQNSHIIAPAGCSTLFQSLHQPAVRGSTLPFALSSPSLVTSDELLHIRTVRRRKEGITVQIEEYFFLSRQKGNVTLGTDFIKEFFPPHSLSLLTRSELVERLLLNKTPLELS